MNVGKSPPLCSSIISVIFFLSTDETPRCDEYVPNDEWGI